MGKIIKPKCWPFEVWPPSSIALRYFLSEESVYFGGMVYVSIKKSMSLERKVVTALTVSSKLISLEKKISRYLCFLKSHYITAQQAIKRPEIIPSSWYAFQSFIQDEDRKKTSSLSLSVSVQLGV